MLCSIGYVLGIHILWLTYATKLYQVTGHLLILKYLKISNINFSNFTLDYDREKNEFIPRMVE